jgi:membrane protein YdbS with pleckstrin-like domain
MPIDVAGRVDRLLDDRVQPLHPRIRLAWTASGAAVAWILALGIGALVLAARDPGESARAALVTIAVVGTTGTVLAAGTARWRYSSWRWRAGSDALELEHGPIVRRASLVPYHRIQQIDVVRGPFARAFGLSSLVVHTAAATSDAEIPGIDAGEADALRRALLERAGIDDAV